MIRDQEALATLLGSVRRFVRERCVPNEARVDAEDAIPAEIENEMKRLGYFAWSIPEEYGGLGLTREELV